MIGGKYTGSNKQKNPILEKLARVLMSPMWENLFPLVSLRKIVRDQSDHNLLLLDSGDLPVDNKKKRIEI